MPEPDLAEHAARALERFASRHAADEERHRHVLHRAELGQEVMKLVYEAERRIACLATLGLAHLADGTSLHEHLSGGRRIEAAEEMQ